MVLLHEQHRRPGGFTFPGGGLAGRDLGGGLAAVTTGSATGPVIDLAGVTKTYGEGETAVHAARRRRPGGRARRLRRDHGRLRVAASRP